MRKRRIYGVITSVFAISYIGRWFLNTHLHETCDKGFNVSEFVNEMAWNAVYFFEGMSMGVLMAFHCKSFSTEDNMFDNDDEVSHITIDPDEYYVFDMGE